MIPFPNKKYNIIYADPPWFYNQRANTGKFRGGCWNHYKPMKNKDILNLPVEHLTNNNCALFLWVTMPNIEVGFEVLKTWGFEYKTVGFTWLKTNPKSGTPFFGVGYYTKSNAELCLLGVKGKMKPISNKVSSAIISPREQHSKKPDIVRDRIVELFGDLPRIELFARQEVDGWDCWGNEVSRGFDFL